MPITTLERAETSKNGFSTRKKRRFLRTLRHTNGNLASASELTRLNLSTVYRHMEADPDFKLEVQLVKRQLAGTLVNVAYQRALEPEGHPDRRMLLRAWLPEEFGDDSDGERRESMTQIAIVVQAAELLPSSAATVPPTTSSTSMMPSSSSDTPPPLPMIPTTQTEHVHRVDETRSPALPATSESERVEA